MSYQKLTASIVIVALLSLSFGNIQCAISSPSDFRQRLEEKKIELQARKEAIKSRWKRRRNHEEPEPPVVSSWRPAHCDGTCAPSGPNNSASFVNSGGQVELLLQINPFTATGGCTSDEQGFQVLLPQGTPANTVNFEIFFDAGSASAIRLVGYASPNPDPNALALVSAADPNSISGSEVTFDLQNTNGGTSAPSGSTISLINVKVLAVPTATIRIRNLRINGVPIQSATLQTFCPPEPF